jgi:hypothetical protein
MSDEGFRVDVDYDGPWYSSPVEVEWDAPACERCGDDHFSTLVYAKEHPEYFPTGSERICESCGARYGRWSHKLLSGQEAEKRYGHQLAEEQ